MNTTVTETDSNLAIAETYYHEMLAKNFDLMGKCLHSDVHFIGPLAELSGKNAVVEAARKLSGLLDDIEIRARFSTGDQIMLAYDFKFHMPVGKLRAAVLMTFQNKLISRIELFYDGRPFAEKKDEIFSQE